MHFSSLKIGQRIALGFAAILLLTIIGLATSLLQLSSVAQQTRAMMDSPLAKERLIADWYALVLSGSQRTTAIVRSPDAELGRYFAETARKSSTDAGQLLKRFEPLISTPAERDLFAKASHSRNQYNAARAEVTKAKDEGRVEDADAIFNSTYAPRTQAYVDSIKALLELQRQDIDATAQAVENTYQRSRTLVLALAALITALGVLIAALLNLGIVRPLKAAVQVADEVADGKLNARIDPAILRGKDETAQLMQSLATMETNLRHLVSEARQGSHAVATAATQIASGNLDLSSRTEEQASSLEQTAASMEELTSTVRHNAASARQANDLAQQTSALAVQGGESVNQVVRTMAGILQTSRRIEDIIGVIDKIAFQTNILALNAAVEAARAGEQGRGFAVVAGDVRSLAQSCANAAKEIKGLIDASAQRIATGSRLVEQAGSTMDQVVQGVQKVTDLVGEISHASQEQMTGLEQVNQAVAQMDQMTQQNAALVEESSAATQSLEIQAAQLTRSLSAFTV